MTNLIDILKETDLRIGFTSLFQTLATHQQLDPKNIQKRLLLCLYGLGTNTGLKKTRYIKRKYIYKDNVKAAIQYIVNAILADQQEEIWGKGTTSCASDSTRVVAYDQS